MLYFQIRLDFTTFVITGPSTSTVSTHYVVNGNIIPTVGPSPAQRLMHKQGSCATDIFVISHQQNVPEVCGTLTGEHGIYHLIIALSKKLCKAKSC